MDLAVADRLARRQAVSGPPVQAGQAQLLFDTDSERVIDAAGATQQLLDYESLELQGLPLHRLFSATIADGVMPWRHSPDEAEGSERMATLLTKAGGSRRLATRVATFRGSAGHGNLGLLLLNDAALPGSGGGRRARNLGRLQTLAYELTVAEARERERLANGLHDSLGQLLAIAQLRLSELQSRLSEGEHKARTEELHELLTQAAQETRRATLDLHSPLLRPLGLQKAIEGLVDRVRRQFHAEIRVEGHIDAPALSETAQAVLLRVVRELLFNAYKHAQARLVTLRLASAAERLVISVVDDGRGCVNSLAARDCSLEGGYGLASAEAQMLAIGGRLDLRSAPGSGTTATVTLPCRRRSARPPGASGVAVRQ